LNIADPHTCLSDQNFLLINASSPNTTDFPPGSMIGLGPTSPTGSNPNFVENLFSANLIPAPQVALWLNLNPNISFAAFGGIPTGSYTGTLFSHDLDNRAPNKIGWTLLMRKCFLEKNGELHNISVDSGAKYVEINSGNKMIQLPDSDYDDFETAI
jgi:hypothetical protein